MESLAEEPWDVVICGTGLQQSLLALALSRSKKRVLHIDPNEYYGGHEAAFSLQEVESFVTAHGDGNDSDGEGDGDHGKDVFRHASVWKHEDAASLGLSFPRAYSLALAPQIIHSRSRLLEQLVSSRAFRQVEFIAVGSFYVYEVEEGDAAAAAAATPTPKLSRIPSSREDVFANRSIPTRSKRSLMKFLKFVSAYDAEENLAVWEARRAQPLATFLQYEFGLDEALRRYVLALTLSLDADVAVADGLASVRRHLTSMGLFGPGFCAVYPKWGGLSEVAQVACRAQAVGGGVYMLGTGMQIEEGGGADGDGDDGISVKLSNGVTVRTSTVVTSRHDAAAPDGPAISRLVAVVNSPLQNLFETTVEGAPTPAVAVVAFPPGTVTGYEDEDAHSQIPPPKNPIYALVHSSDTGECPKGQAVIYLTTSTCTSPSSGPHPDPESSQRLLDRALDSLLCAATATATTTPTPAEDPSSSGDDSKAEAKAETPTALYKLRYVQQAHSSSSSSSSITTQTPAPDSSPAPASAPETPIFSFPAPAPSSASTPTTNTNFGLLSFDDGTLDAVKAAWELVMRRANKGKESKKEEGQDGDDKDDVDVDDDGEYMVFQDREGVGSDHGYGDDVYD